MERSSHRICRGHQLFTLASFVAAVAHAAYLPKDIRYTGQANLLHQESAVTHPPAQQISIECASNPNVLYASGMTDASACTSFKNLKSLETATGF